MLQRSTLAVLYAVPLAIAAAGCGRNPATPTTATSKPSAEEVAHESHESPELLADASDEPDGDAAEPDEATPSETASVPAERLMILLAGGPLLVDLRMTIDGASEAVARPVRDASRRNKTLILDSSRTLYYEPRRNSRVWQLLDGDQDGTLSPEEIAAAPQRLLSRDADDDGVIYPHDLENLREQIRAAEQMAGTVSRRDEATRHAALLLHANTDWQLVGATLSDLYAAGSMLTANCFPAIPGLFAALDTDGSGRLSTRELALLLEQPTHLSLNVDYDARSVESYGSALTVANWAESVVSVAEASPARLVLHVAGEVVIISAHDAMPLANFLEEARQRIAALDRDGNGYLDQEELLTEKTEETEETEDAKETEGAVGAEEAEGSAAERFAAMDADGNGMVTAEELADYLRLESAAARSQIRLGVHDQGDALFERLDTDRDGRLGEREIALATRELQSLDANGDGRITANEVTGHISVTFIRGEPGRQTDLSLYATTPPRQNAAHDEAPEWFVKSDLNGDGYVSAREFVGTREQFDRLDADGDGFLSPAEVQAP